MLRNARGNAIIEIVPILAIFILIVNFALGFFGLIHSGILASIGARNYAFETFRNRADLRYIRDTPESRLDFTYAKAELRFHVVRSENHLVTTDSTPHDARLNSRSFVELRKKRVWEKD